MSATNFCESSSFMVKNEVEVLYVFDNSLFKFCVFIDVKIKQRMKVLNISCKSTRSGDVREIANLLNYSQI